MSHIFISYSRKDIDFAERIVQALAENNLETWIDWKDIPKAEEWLQEIYRGIEAAEAFLFLISPDSLASKVCNQELEHAVLNGKRIIPIIIRDPEDMESVPKSLTKLNWIFCRDGQDDFSKAITETRKTVQTDYEWVRYHTRLQLKALDWEGMKDVSRLLRGKELREAEERLVRVNSKEDLLPTDLQQKYLLHSQKNEEKEKKDRRRLTYILAVGVLLALGFGIFLVRPYLSRERAVPGNWVRIPEGSFVMGMDEAEANLARTMCLDGVIERYKEQCDSEYEVNRLWKIWSGRQYDAWLPEFSILDNEVTNAQYQQCIFTGICVAPGWGYTEGDGNKPATQLDWFQAETYCEWIGGRLPTEGEWEKAARGPQGYPFPWGKEWDASKANLELSGISAVQNVLKYAELDVSGYGVKNLAGNVSEWTASVDGPQNSEQPFSNKVLTKEDADNNIPVILRGGYWENVRTEGMVATRARASVSKLDNNVGFRCVCTSSQSCKSPWTLGWIWLGKY